MNEQEVVKLLDTLALNQTLITQAREKYGELRDKVLESVKAELADLDAEWLPQISNVENRNITLTEQIKQGVVEQGHTVKGQSLMGVYMSGRVTWETKYLDGYMKAHPEIAEWRKQGDPSAQIRKV